MVPEMEMVREVTKLKGDFGRNKESKWLTDFNKLEDEAKRKKRYAAATPYPFVVAILQYITVPLAQRLKPA